jgi:hypothetical protein
MYNRPPFRLSLRTEESQWRRIVGFLPRELTLDLEEKKPWALPFPRSEAVAFL